MPVTFPDGLPAAGILAKENIFVMPASRASRQDIRPLKVAILNIMPTKPTTETQLLRLLSGTIQQVVVTFLHPQSHTCKTTPPEHLARFYRNFEDVKRERFDCLIITGAPVETLDFGQVSYWDELRGILDWSRTHVYSTMHICWGAQAGMYHHYGIPKHPLEQKLFGVFAHRIVDGHSTLVRGFDDIFNVPHSRHTTVLSCDIAKSGAVSIIAESDVAGVCIASAKNDRQVFVTGHSEYDPMTLAEEYRRDRERGLSSVSLPVNYFPLNDPQQFPVVTWRSHASLFWANWLCGVYEAVPFDLNDLEPLT